MIVTPPLSAGLCLSSETLTPGPSVPKGHNFNGKNTLLSAASQYCQNQYAPYKEESCIAACIKRPTFLRK